MNTRLRAAAVALFAIVVLITMATPAQALSRRTVCAQDVWVRACPACSPPTAILYRNETFDYDHSAFHNGFQWAYGFAWGGENVWGWLPYSAITNSSGQC